MIDVPRYTALELDTGQVVEGFYHLENGYLISNGKPDFYRPVERHFIVDVDGRHREIAETTLDETGV